jgi:hypothetical protein
MEEMMKQMLKNMWDSIIIAMELNAYQRTLKDYYSVLGPDQIEHIRKKIDELSAK